MTTEIALRFPTHQGYTNQNGANPGPSTIEMIAYAMDAYRAGQLSPAMLSKIMDDIMDYRDDDYYNSLTPRCRAILMAAGMSHRSFLVDIQRRRSRIVR